MNHLKVYFLAYFMQNSQKLNMVGYTASNMWPKRYGGPCGVTWVKIQNLPTSLMIKSLLIKHTKCSLPC